MSLITKGYVPSNTRKQTDWAVRVFSEWRRKVINLVNVQQTYLKFLILSNLTTGCRVLLPKLETAKVNRILLKRFKTYLVVSKE